MSPPPPTRRRWLIYSVVALIFGSGVWYFGFKAEVPQPTSPFGFSRTRGKGKSPPSPVRVVAAKKQDLSVHLRAIGTVVPLNSVTVKSRVEGQLLKISFEDGQQVEKGQVLAEIDPLPYKIKLSQAEANLRQNQSQLRTAVADLERFKTLNSGSGNLVTQQQLEAQQALVAEREGAVAADQAMVEDARRQLAYTRIEAPISGRLGIRQIDAGNLVRTGDANGLVTLTQTKPIAVTFTIPEVDLQKVVEPLRAGEHLEVEAWDRNEQTKLASGMLKTVDNQIDLATGTLRLKAEFPNADEKLFPNQFVNVRLRVRTLKDVLVVPAPAVLYGSRGTYVYLVNAESQSTVRDIVLGPSDGTNQSVAKGLEPGELVVLEGLDRLREGRVVTIVGPEAAPTGAKAGGKGGKGGKGKGGEGKSGEGKKKDK
jgi:multidrug efflux system membrane fusion protein